MGAPVLYLRRSARGARLAGVELIGDGLDASWNAGSREGVEVATEAAAWVRGQLRAARLPARLAAVCLDADGALASWVSSPVGGDATALAASVQQPGLVHEIDDDEEEHVGSDLALSADAASPALASITPMGVCGGGRIGALATPDLAARLLLDALDAVGVEAGEVVSVWHALARAWDPGARDHGTRGGDRVVASEGGGTAAVIAPDDAGRLLWAWSRGGEVIAAGSCRLRTVGENGDRRALIGRDALARLAVDWIAWGAQLGASPGRVVALLPEGAWDDEASLASSLSAVWPDSTVDLIEEDAPVETALGRLRNSVAPDAGLVQLATRPGRAHRAMHRWTGIAVLLAGLALGLTAWRVHGSAGAFELEAQKTKEEWRTLAAQIDPRSTEPGAGDALLFLQDELATRQAQFTPVQTIPPIMQELEAVAQVLQDPWTFELRKIQLNPTLPMVQVQVPDIGTYETVLEVLGTVGGSTITDWRGDMAMRGGGVEATFRGRWPDTEGQP